MTEFSPARIRVQHLNEMVANGEVLTALTCYDALTARILDAAGIDILVVGDSIGNTALGFSSTIQVTLEDIERATSAVMRGTTRAFIIADMPMGTYEESPAQAIRTAIRLVRAGADAVKLEGGEAFAPTVEALTKAGINVVAHVGYRPHADAALGGPRVQGRDEEESEAIIDDAVSLEKAGAIAVVVEMVPGKLGAKITEILSVPTLGIGAGYRTSGQLLVWPDMAGMTEWQPSYAKRFGEVCAALSNAVTTFRTAVKGREFPDKEHSF